MGKKVVNKGKEKYAELVLTEDATNLIKKGEQSNNVTYEIKTNNLEAPLKKGDIVGTLILKENNKKIKTINITVKNNIDKANFIDLYLHNFKDIISGEIDLK